MSITNLLIFASWKKVLSCRPLERLNIISLGLPQPPSSPGSSSSVMTPLQLAVPPSTTAQHCVTLSQTAWTPAASPPHRRSLTPPQFSRNTSVCCLHMLSSTHTWTAGNNWRKNPQMCWLTLDSWPHTSNGPSILQPPTLHIHCFMCSYLSLKLPTSASYRQSNDYTWFF